MRLRYRFGEDKGAALVISDRFCVCCKGISIFEGGRGGGFAMLGWLGCVWVGWGVGCCVADGREKRSLKIGFQGE